MQTILEPESLASTSMQELMREMLVRLGENPERDGLRDTPARMERSLQYLTKGYQENPEETLLGAMFDVAYDEMVIVKDIEMFRSYLIKPPQAVCTPSHIHSGLLLTRQQSPAAATRWSHLLQL